MKIVVTFFFVSFYVSGLAQSNSCKPNVPMAVIIDSVFYDGKNKVSQGCKPCYLLKATDNQFKVTKATITVDYCNSLIILPELISFEVKNDTVPPQYSRYIKIGFAGPHPIDFDCITAKYQNGNTYVLQPIYYNAKGWHR